LLVEFSQTVSHQTPGKCLHHLFEDQAQLTPDNVAVIFEEEKLTYADLNTRANQLAHRLRKLGVGPEVKVAICTRRSVEMITGIIAVLKAGGAYVPLDPEYPRGRLSFVLSEIKAPVLLIQSNIRESLPEHRAHLICLDSDWDSLSLEKTENPQAAME